MSVTTNPNITGVGAGGGGEVDTTYTTVAYSATPTLTANTNIRIVCTNNITINPPAGTPTDGSLVRLWLVNPTTGGLGSAINVSLNASLVIPSSSSATSPISVAVGAKLVLTIQYDAFDSAWKLATLINGYGGY